MTIYAYVNGPLGLLHLHDPQPQIIFNIPTSFSKLRLPKLSDHLSKGTLSLTHLKKKSLYLCIWLSQNWTRTSRQEQRIRHGYHMWRTKKQWHWDRYRNAHRFILTRVDECMKNIWDAINQMEKNNLPISCCLPSGRPHTYPAGYV